MRYIIMCGGDYGFPRHFATIGGVPLIYRTVSQLKKLGITPEISTNDERFSEFADIIRHKNDFTVENDHVTGGAWVDCFYPTNEPTCYIFGDVVFSDSAIKTIVERETDSIDFFASCPPFSHLFIKEWAEPFAFKVQDQARFRAAIDFVKANLETGIFRRHPIAWELWQVIHGRDVREIDYGSYLVINDYTCDIDHPEDAPRIEAMMCRY